MPSSSKQTNVDLSAILEGLAQAGVEFILVGGLAAVVQGAPVTTMDVDIVHERSSENVKRLLEFLKSINAIHRRPDDKIIEPTENHLSGQGHSLFTTLIGPLDVLAFIEDGQVFEDLIEHTIEIEFRQQKIKVLNLKKLVEIKQASTHPKDKQRLLVLEETLRQLGTK